MIRQRTLKNEIRATGVGLHTGKKVLLTLRPAPIDSGIVFRRVDLEPAVEIKARAENVGDTTLSTTLINGDVRISTVEHLLSALAGLGIDNAIVEVSADEVPIMDGSSAPFIDMINDVGLEQQAEVRQVITVNQAVGLTEARTSASASFIPSLVPWMDMTIEFSERLIGRQKLSLPLTSHHFNQNVARARTFGFEEHLQDLKRRGFARGSSLDNAVLIADHKVVNAGGLRYADEFVRHDRLQEHGQHRQQRPVDGLGQHVPEQVFVDLVVGVTLDGLHQHRGQDADQQC